MGLLFTSTHPEFSDHLVHFTDRLKGHGWLPEPVYKLSATERLESILGHQTIWPSQPFGAAAPVVCFAEATTVGLNYLIGTVGYRPWGVVFDRQAIYDRQGGPVFHYRPDEWEGDLAALPPRLQARFVRFEAGDSEWLWEREWRVVFEDGEPGFQFDLGDVAALIVGDAQWPPLEPDPAYSVLGDDIAAQMAIPPAWFPNCERLWWNSEEAALEVLA